MNEHTFSELMHSSLVAVYHFVRPYAHSDDEAEDMVQDAFVKAWKAFRHFDTTKKWKPWIFTIARNTALDHIKKKRAVPFSEINVAEDDTEFVDTLQDTEPLAAELFARIEDIAAVTDAIRRLRREYNSVLMLHYHQELTFEEIATIMAIPMNTVKSWHRRALIELKVLLKSGAPKHY